MDDDFDLALRSAFEGPVDQGRLRRLAVARLGTDAAAGFGEVLLRGFERAVAERDGVDVEALLIISAQDDHGCVAERHVPVLGALLRAEWHLGHEDVVSCLEAVGGDATLPALIRALDARPDYLDRVDGCAALHRRIVWAVAKVGTEAARATLQSLAGSGLDTVVRHAEKRLLLFTPRAG